jgi:non-lysosomal glucosylceramidase
MIFLGMLSAHEPETADPLSEKKFSLQWIDSLTQRGTHQVYSGENLKYIGMPIGGLNAGQLYLGGDGRLWRWDIFNRIVGTPPSGESYKNPPTSGAPGKQGSPVDQGFALRVTDGSTSQVRRLDKGGFENITFCGEYPMGFVTYQDKACPVTVSLAAFSPFIPLNVDDSSLPATVMRFTLKNTGNKPVDADLGGWLENAVCNYTAQAGAGIRRNRILREPKTLMLECSAAGPSLKEQPDFGTMTLSLLDSTEEDRALPSLAANAPESIFENKGSQEEQPIGQKLVGALSRKVSLTPGESRNIDFLLTWYFPNLHLNGLKTKQGRYYATRFDSAAVVARYISNNFERLAGQTQLWHDTWYDSTLPYWFLDRTFANTSTLATSTAYRLGDGRFYGWESVGLGEGTCTHVWSYEQAMGRLFPELDMLLRERSELKAGIGFGSDGVIGHRGEFNMSPAVDGQAGTILRAYRDYQMSPDDAFLKRNWPNVKLATEWLIHQPGGEDGILTGAQHNTLDTEWYGPVSWLSGLYLASLRASEEMAKEMGDADFAEHCRQIFERGSKRLVPDLFNGEYFINKTDPQHPEAINSGDGCEIDQVLGQSWAFQVGLGRIFPEKETRSALQALWHYNFMPDVGPFRKANPNGRWYAVAGESGLVMSTFPQPDWNYEKAKGKSKGTNFCGYFNECMSGFEHQVAGHMIWEGMTEQGLAIERAVHDRYSPSKRNPWDEVEWGEHYARAMASYGVFIAACGYEYNGPKGYLAFAPRIGPENFKAAFTAAEGWGSFSQKQDDHNSLTAVLQVKYGQLKLKTLGLNLPEGVSGSSVKATVGDMPLAAKTTVIGTQIQVTFIEEIVLDPSQILTIIILR